ncbi:hypothetical protein ACKGJN_12955 [Gillisia sp. Q332]|uniref:hypothetical protein n=1 Tax=Gillisia xinjiangensis TaxID=3384765 RepID=UPI00391936DA
MKDLNWFPDFLRDYGTDFLQFLSNLTNMFHPIIIILQKGLEKSGTYQIIDLGSGGGGPLPKLNKTLKKHNPGLKISLTDYFPNIDALELAKGKSDNIGYIKTPVDARNLPNHLKGLRTFFLTFHHFKPEGAKIILQNAVGSKSPIAIFEGQERSFVSLLAMFLSPVSVLLTSLFIKPFKLGRLLFTYIIPLVSLFVWRDGIVSSLRTYSEEKMNDMINELKNKDDFEWEVGRIRSGPGFILYLLGVEKKIERPILAEPELMLISSDY